MNTNINTATQPNYYEILGLTSSCSSSDLKKKYHQLALIWHPDKHDHKTEAQTKFAIINEAYIVLSDALTRKIYDTCLEARLPSLPKFADSVLLNSKSASSMVGSQNLYEQALNLLQNIFQESDKEVSTEVGGAFTVPKGLKTALKSYIHENVVSRDGDTKNFFAEYQPTFLDTSFSEQFASFNHIYINQNPSAEVYTAFLEQHTTKTKDSSEKQSKSRKSGLRNASKSVRPTFDQKSNRKKFKNGKRAFLVNDEGEFEEDEFHISSKRPKCLRKQSYCSDTYGEIGNVTQHQNSF